MDPFLMNNMWDNGCKLRERREFLEQYLKDKYSELTKICVREAELTGKLPVETPFGPDGSLPKFRPVLRTINLNTDDFYRNQDSKQVEVVSKRNGRVKGSPKKSRIRSIWETLPSISGKNSDSSLTALTISNEISTWPHRASPTKPNRSHPYIVQNKT